MGRRRTQRTDDTLRQLLLKDHRKRFGPGGRWHIPGRVSEYEQALVAGEAIVIDSGTIMCALMLAGLPHDRFCFGGVDFGKHFLLDERDRLSDSSDNRGSVSGRGVTLAAHGKQAATRPVARRRRA